MDAPCAHSWRPYRICGVFVAASSLLNQGTAVYLPRMLPGWYGGVQRQSGSDLSNVYRGRNPLFHNSVDEWMLFLVDKALNSKLTIVTFFLEKNFSRKKTCTRIPTKNTAGVELVTSDETWRRWLAR